MLTIIWTEFQKLKRYHILLIGIVGMTLSPILGLVTQSVAIEEARNPHFDLPALVSNTIWNNAAIFMPIVFTLIGGYLIRREYTDDTLKNILTVPVSYRKLLAGKLAATGLLALLIGLYSFVVAIAVGALAGLRGMDAPAFAKGLLQMGGISAGVYIAVLPLVALCGRLPGLYMGGSAAAFVLGYSGMFFKSGVLRSIYPFLAPFAAIGFDTGAYISAENAASAPLGLASLGAMLALAAGIVAASGTPGEIRTRRKKHLLSLRPAQRERKP